MADDGPLFLTRRGMIQSMLAAAAAARGKTKGSTLPLLVNADTPITTEVVSQLTAEGQKAFAWLSGATQSDISLRTTASELNKERKKYDEYVEIDPAQYAKRFGQLYEQTIGSFEQYYQQTKALLNARPGSDELRKDIDEIRELDNISKVLERITLHPDRHQDGAKKIKDHIAGAIRETQRRKKELMVKYGVDSPEKIDALMSSLNSLSLYTDFNTAEEALLSKIGQTLTHGVATLQYNERGQLGTHIPPTLSVPCCDFVDAVMMQVCGRRTTKEEQKELRNFYEDYAEKPLPYFFEFLDNPELSRAHADRVSQIPLWAVEPYAPREAVKKFPVTVPIIGPLNKKEQRAYFLAAARKHGIPEDVLAPIESYRPEEGEPVRPPVQARIDSAVAHMGSIADIVAGIPKAARVIDAALAAAEAMARKSGQPSEPTADKNAETPSAADVTKVLPAPVSQPTPVVEPLKRGVKIERGWADRVKGEEATPSPHRKQ